MPAILLHNWVESLVCSYFLGWWTRTSRPVSMWAQIRWKHFHKSTIIIKTSELPVKIYMLMCFFANINHVGLKSQLMVNKSAKIFILGYNLNSLDINDKRGDYRGILLKIFLKSVKSATTGPWSGLSLLSRDTITESSANLMIWCPLYCLWHAFVYKTNKSVNKTPEVIQWKIKEHLIRHHWLSHVTPYSSKIQQPTCKTRVDVVGTF